jgi:hypothetical protein
VTIAHLFCRTPHILPPSALHSAPMTAPLSDVQIRRWCRRLVRDLDLRQPFGADDLCQRVAARRDRPIRVRAVDLGGTTNLGHLIPRRSSDHILVDRSAPAPQRDLVVFHEVVHLLRDHLGEPLTCADQAYGDWREREAELGARVLAALSTERPRPNLAGPAEQPIAAAFGFVEP